MMTTCPKCAAQLEVRLVYASGPKKTEQSSAAAVDDLEYLLEKIDIERLRDKELDFVTKTKARFAQYGDKTQMSEKQMNWLESIADKF